MPCHCPTPGGGGETYNTPPHTHPPPPLFKKKKEKTPRWAHAHLRPPGAGPRGPRPRPARRRGPPPARAAARARARTPRCAGSVVCARARARARVRARARRAAAPRVGGGTTRARAAPGGGGGRDRTRITPARAPPRRPPPRFSVCALPPLETRRPPPAGLFGRAAWKRRLSLNFCVRLPGLCCPHLWTHASAHTPRWCRNNMPPRLLSRACGRATCALPLLFSPPPAMHARHQCPCLLARARARLFLLPGLQGCASFARLPSTPCRPCLKWSWLGMLSFVFHL